MLIKSHSLNGTRERLLLKVNDNLDNREAVDPIFWTSVKDLISYHLGNGYLTCRRFGLVEEMDGE